MFFILNLYTSLLFYVPCLFKKSSSSNCNNMALYRYLLYIVTVGRRVQLERHKASSMNQWSNVPERKLTRCLKHTRTSHLTSVFCIPKHRDTGTLYHCPCCVQIMYQCDVDYTLIHFMGPYFSFQTADEHTL